MVDPSAPSDDTPSLQVILDALDDAECRTILRKTTEPMTANELNDICDISQTTLYRKLDLLSTASLVREEIEINPNGSRITKYQRDFDDVTIHMSEEGDFSVKIERPQREADERLADIWSKMGDEI
ncbi:ArsR family transcriptional regulator [halophilic archaeon]|nr:ArsR family transcriptional regulator [halophilic archaeon]